MTLVYRAVLLSALAIGLASPGFAGDSSNPAVKVLATPVDPGEQTVLVGRTLVEDMIIQLELEPAKGMWMAPPASVGLVMDPAKGRWMAVATPSMWSKHMVGKGDLYHVEVKPIDPMSKTRIPYVDVMFKALNRDNGQRVEGALHPMWGGSGLHYAFNSKLAGDGVYEATVTVGVPTFARDLKESDRWMEPTSAKFHFRLTAGKITEVSETSAKVASN